MKRNTLPVLMGIFLWYQSAAAADWHVRLAVTAPDDPPPIRMDSSNVFGRLHDSVDGLDSHDLGELPPPCRINGRQIPQHRLSASRMERKL